MDWCCTRAAWLVSPGSPDEKSLPAFAATDPVPNYCKLQPTSTDSATFFTPGLRLRVSSVVGVLLPGP